jgi:hypothetical protein
MAEECVLLMNRTQNVNEQSDRPTATHFSAVEHSARLGQAAFPDFAVRSELGITNGKSGGYLPIGNNGPLAVLIRADFW